MRKLLFSTVAAAAVMAFAGAASAQVQTNNTPVGAVLNLQNINVNGVTVGNAQAVGNAFNATGAINVNAFNGAVTDEQNNSSAINATVNVDNSDFDGASTIGSLALANSISVDVGGTVRLNANDSSLQTNTGVINARTDIAGSDFDQDVNASATGVGNNLNVTGAFYTQGGRNYFNNNGAVSSELEISNSTFGQTGLNYALTGGATSIGNNANLDSVAGGRFEQTNEARITATVDLDAVRGLGNGSSLTAAAIGNAASVGDNRSTISQAGRNHVRADFDMDDSRFANGTFSAQAVYNLAEVTGTASVGQSLRTGGSVGADLDVNGSRFDGTTSFNSTAIANFADLSGGTGGQSAVNNMINASADLTNVTGVGAVNVNSTAASNVMNVSGSMVGMSQISDIGSVFSQTTIANSNFGSLTAGATSIGNSLTVSVPTP